MRNTECLTGDIQTRAILHTRDLVNKTDKEEIPALSLFATLLFLLATLLFLNLK